MSTIQDYPSVTVAIPVLDEEQHIQRVVEGFLSTGYPNLIEILIADGGSKDKTKQIINALSEKDNRVKIIDNPDRFQSYGLIHMIEIAVGAIFLRPDGHCYYNKDQGLGKQTSQSGSALRCLSMTEYRSLLR